MNSFKFKEILGGEYIVWNSYSHCVVVLVLGYFGYVLYGMLKFQSAKENATKNDGDSQKRS